MSEPPSPYWKILRLVILLMVGVGAAISYAWIVAVMFGLDLSGLTLSILAVVGAAIGFLTWVLISVS